MPIEIKDMDAGRGVIIRGWGFLTDQEYKQALREHLTQTTEKLQGYYWSLSDFTAMTGTDAKTETIREVAQMCVGAAESNVNPVVAIAGTKDLAFGLSRMFEMLVSESHWQVSVFRTQEEAISWIRKIVKERFDFDAVQEGESSEFMKNS